MILVPLDTPGVEIVRDLLVFGYNDQEGHAEVTFTDVRVPASNLLANEGDGFMISQARLGPGRIHHCMRTIGAAERALELMCKRAQSRVTFGQPVAERSNIQDWIAESRIEIEMMRLLTMKTAWLMDTVGNKRGADGDRGDQGRRARDRPEGHRPRDPGPRRRRRVAGLPAGLDVRAPAHAAARRRARRGPQAHDRPRRAAQVRGPGRPGSTNGAGGGARARRSGREHVDRSDRARRRSSPAPRAASGRRSPRACTRRARTSS